MTLIDTHAHYYLSQFDEDLELCISRALEAGVKKIVLPNIDSESLPSLRKLCSSYPNLFVPAIGLHPTHVKAEFEAELGLIMAELEKGNQVGIGETGIDLYWDKTFLEEQKKAFEVQVRFALKHDFPVIIHARESYQEIVDVLKQINAPVFKGIFHAFSGNLEQAKEVVDMGFYIGIGGVVTFKNSQLPDVIKGIDLNHIVLETDSPYLAPTPHRGKRNESSYLLLIAEKVADVSRKSVEQVAEITTLNATKLFKL